VKTERDRTQERGAAFVEAALTSLMLTVIMFAIFEAGRLINIQQTLTNAAREGARLSVLPAWGGTDTLPSTTAVQARVQTFLDAAGLNGASATVTVVNDHTVGTTKYSLVTVTVPYKVVSVSMFRLLEVNLRGRSMMRNETNLQ
jgi:Flp pilus assembly protein TadG